MSLRYGPEQGQTHLSAGLDYYKPTMSQLEHDRLAGMSVTFSFKDRGHADLLRYVEPAVLKDRLARFQHGWQADEIAFLASQQRRDGTPLFNSEYLRELEAAELPPVQIADDGGQLHVTASGEAYLVTFWETVVMSEINELYFENYVRQHGLDVAAVYQEGDDRLSEKIAVLNARPDIRFADFGTRRRFSYRWHKHVLERLATECPENLIGTSNTWLAHEFGLMPIGTFAHELPMIYAARSDKQSKDPLEGHRLMLKDWKDLYDDNLSTALTDTFGSDFFFASFTDEEAADWAGLRHDSGDPIEFGERVLRFYEQRGIDPHTKTIVFSDGLDIDEIVRLADHFAGRVQTVFGWGTTLTNDLGIPALNIVMKAVEADGQPTVKLSDNDGKHTGSETDVRRYKQAVAAFCAKAATRQAVSLAV